MNIICSAEEKGDPSNWVLGLRACLYMLRVVTGFSSVRIKQLQTKTEGLYSCLYSYNDPDFWFSLTVNCIVEFHSH